MSNADWLRLIVLSPVWGGAFFFVEVAVRHLPPMTVVVARVGLGAGLLGEALEARQIAGMARIVAGLLVPDGRQFGRRRTAG